MNRFKADYRIVRDKFSGYEVQKRLWYFPFWFQIKGVDSPQNTNSTIEEANYLIKIDRTNTRSEYRD